MSASFLLSLFLVLLLLLTDYGMCSLKSSNTTNSSGEIIDNNDMSNQSMSFAYLPLSQTKKMFVITDSPNSKLPPHFIEAIKTKKESQAGATGNTGPQGLPGRSGVTGATGHLGGTGASGPSGSKGPPGVQGPPGRTGARGGHGPMGPPGHPPAGCHEAWTDFLKVHSFGGQPIKSLKSISLDQCRMSCLIHPSCYAIDFDRLSIVCYLHVDPNNLLVRLSTNDVDQYILDRCHSNGSYGSGKFTVIPLPRATPRALKLSSNSFDFQDGVNPSIVAATTSLLVTSLVIGIVLAIFALVRCRQLRNREVALGDSVSIIKPSYSETQSTSGLSSPSEETKTMMPGTAKV